MSDGLTLKNVATIPDKVTVDVHNHFNCEQSPNNIDAISGVMDHQWSERQLLLKLQCKCGDKEYQPFDLLIEECPHVVAECILNNQVDGNGYKNVQQCTRWARVHKRCIKMTLWHLHQLHCFYPTSASDGALCGTELTLLFAKTKAPCLHCTTGCATPQIVSKKKAKKAGHNNQQLGQVLCGIRVPNNVEEAHRLNERNDNRLWRQTMEKEISAPIAFGCFNFRPPHFQPGPEHQQAPL